MKTTYSVLIDKIFMQYLSRFTALFALIFLMNGANGRELIFNHAFDKASFYAVLASSKAAEIDKMITEVKASTINEKTAYEGALLMKKAGLLGKPKDKLKVFKQGRALLEAAINNDNSNVEFHFLRLIIQENAPKILNYKTDLPDDSKIVKSLFAKLSAPVQQVVKDYSKTSKVVSPSDF